MASGALSAELAQIWGTEVPGSNFARLHPMEMLSCHLGGNVLNNADFIVHVGCILSGIS